VNLGKQVILSAATMAVISGCSGSEGAAPERLASQAQPLAVGSAPLVAATFSDAGLPIVVHPTAVGIVVPTQPAPGTQSANAAQVALGDATEVAKLRSIALGVSSIAGVSSPTSMLAVAASDHQAAEYILSGAIVYDHVPVYVIKIAGGPFTSPQHPYGVPAPQGNFLVVTLDAATHRVTDVQYVNAEPDLGRIGSGAPSVDLASP
jgi:hypothetical protein